MTMNAKRVCACAGLLGVFTMSATGLEPVDTAKPSPSAEKAHTPLINQPGDKSAIFEGEPKLIASGFKFTEGPLWLADRGELIFSDIPSNKIMRWKPGSEAATAWRDPSGRANGNCLDKQGRLVTCESDGRMTRAVLIPDGVKDVQPIAERFEDKRLNSPNDVVVREADGSVYFTDPSFFVQKADRQLDFCGVFRIKADGSLQLLDKSLKMPNGLAFGVDGKTLYVSDTATSLVHEFAVKDDGSLGEPRIFVDLQKLELPKARGNADGLKVDVRGNVYSTGPGGVVCVSPKGELLGNIIVAGATNMCFGGADKRDLYITAGKAVHHVRTVNPGR